MPSSPKLLGNISHIHSLQSTAGNEIDPFPHPHQGKDDVQILQIHYLMRQDGDIPNILLALRLGDIYPYPMDEMRPTGGKKLIE